MLVPNCFLGAQRCRRAGLGLLFGREQIASFLGAPVDGMVATVFLSARMASGSFSRAPSQWERRAYGDDILAGELLRQTPSPSTRSIAWSPDGSRIAIKHPEAVEIWDAVSGERVLALKTASEQYCYGESGIFMSASTLNYDRRVQRRWFPGLAAAMRDGGIGIWGCAVGRGHPDIARTRNSRDCFISRSRWRPCLASGAWDGSAIVWDLRSGKPVNRMENWAPPSSAPAFNPAVRPAADWVRKRRPSGGFRFAGDGMAATGGKRLRRGNFSCRPL